MLVFKKNSEKLTEKEKRCLAGSDRTHTRCVARAESNTHRDYKFINLDVVTVVLPSRVGGLYIMPSCLKVSRILGS